MRILFYISGHGFGHAVRMAELMRHLLKDARVTMNVRTAAHPGLFPIDPRVVVEDAAIDTPVRESSDALRIDGPGTASSWAAAVAANTPLVAAEARIAIDRGTRLIIADVPYLAGLIAAQTGIPAAGISNFTWNWILEPFLDAGTMQCVLDGYRGLGELWQLPFGHSDGLGMFRQVAPVPLIATAPKLARTNVRERLGIPLTQQILLLSFRGSVAEAAIASAREQTPGFAFLDMSAAMQACPELTFADLAAASDAVMGKLGYGLVAACVANQFRLLHVPREGFREDEITRAIAPLYTCIHELPHADFTAGAWAPHLEVLLSAPMPPAAMRADGASHCAQRILHLLD